MNFLVIGDPHIRLNDESADLMIEKIIETCKKVKNLIEGVIIMGDVLHTHERIHLIPLKKAHYLINSLSVLCKVFVLIGNHDRANNNDFCTDIHAFYSYNSYSNVKIISKPFVYTITNNKKVIFVPYVPNGMFNKALNICCDFSDNKSVNKINVKSDTEYNVKSARIPEDIPEDIHKINVKINNKSNVKSDTEYNVKSARIPEDKSINIPEDRVIHKINVKINDESNVKSDTEYNVKSVHKIEDIPNDRFEDRVMHKPEEIISQIKEYTEIVKDYTNSVIDRNINKEQDDVKVNINEVECIFAHQEFKGCKLSRTVNSLNGDVWPIKYPFIFSGHIHHHHYLQENVMYVGTPRQTDFGEEYDKFKRIWLVSFDTNGKLIKQFKDINLCLPKYKTYYCDIEQIDNFKIEKPSSYCRIMIRSDTVITLKDIKNISKINEYRKAGCKIIISSDVKESMKDDTEFYDPVKFTRNDFIEKIRNNWNNSNKDEQKAIYMTKQIDKIKLKYSN